MQGCDALGIVQRQQRYNLEIGNDRQCVMCQEHATNIGVFLVHRRNRQIDIPKKESVNSITRCFQKRQAHRNLTIFTT